MSVESVRADIQDAVMRLKLEGCVPTMTSALMCWREYLRANKLSGLSRSDEDEYRREFQRIEFLLTEVFPQEESDD